MDYVNLGTAGLRVSRICLGMLNFGSKRWREWVLPEEETRPIVARAAELGINFFDTANVYSYGVSEEITGRVLKDIFGGRDEYVVATKVCQAMGEKPNQSGLSRKHILHSIDGSLRRLGLDHVDLYQIHRWDPATPIEETMAVLHDVVRAGKARYIGASSMYAWQFAKALFTADLRGWTRFVSMQNHYNVIYREEEREMIPLCIDQGIGLIPWSPLARGFIAGNRTVDKGGETTRARTDTFAHSLYYDDVDFAITDCVGAVAARHGTSRAKVALAWLLEKPGITSPVVGATKIQHVEDAAGAVDVRLDSGDIDALERLYKPKRILGM